jgi:sortase A
MKFGMKRAFRLSRRTERLVGWTRLLLITTGTIALAYVAFTALDASLYQVSAKRSLESQIQAENEHKLTGPRPAVKRGDVLGRMDIPRLGVSVAVLQGTSSQMLRVGAGHIEGTPLPGDPGNSGIAGHRDTFFRGLKDIRRNDEIRFQTATGLFLYQVDWVNIVAPDDMSVLAPSAEATLTLVTCYPFYFVGSAPNRFVVRAHKYSSPLPPASEATP